MDYIWTLIIFLVVSYFVRLQIRSEFEMEFVRTFDNDGSSYIRAGVIRRAIANGVDFIPVLYFYSYISHLEIPLLISILSVAAVEIAYYLFFLTMFKQTAGDMIFKIKTISLTNRELDFKQVAKRMFFHIVLFPVLIVQIPILRSQREPFLPDKLSQTEIVQVRAGLGEKWIN